MLTLSGCISGAWWSQNPGDTWEQRRRCNPDAPRRRYMLSPPPRPHCGDQTAFNALDGFNSDSLKKRRLQYVISIIFYSKSVQRCVCFVSKSNKRRVWDRYYEGGTGRGEKGLNIFAHLSLCTNHGQLSLIWMCVAIPKGFSIVFTNHIMEAVCSAQA